MNIDDMKDVANICCIGATRVGVLSTLVAAEKWPQKNFVIVDEQNNIDRWISPQWEHREPGLSELIAKQVVGVCANVDGNVPNVAFQTPNLYQQVNDAQIIIVAAMITTKKGLGKRKQLDVCDWDKEMRRWDLRKWDSEMRGVLSVATQPKFIIMKCRLPAENVLTTLENIVKDIDRYSNNKVASQHHIFWVPEFFFVGTAINEIRNPARVVISPCRPTTANTSLIANLYLNSPVGWVQNNTQIIICSPQSAIIGTMGSNVMSEIHAMVVNGISYSQDQEDLVKKMLDSICCLADRTVTVFGFSSKENTGEVVNSTVMRICRKLVLERVRRIRIYDPYVSQQDILECFAKKHTKGDDALISVIQKSEDLWLNSDVFCFFQRLDLTDLNWHDIFNQAHNQGAVHLFDTCNALEDHLHSIKQVKRNSFPVFLLH